MSLLKAQISQISKLQISSRANQNSLNQKPKKTKILLHIWKKNPSMNSFLPLPFCFDKIHCGNITTFPAHFHLPRCNFDLFHTSMCWFMVFFRFLVYCSMFSKGLYAIKKKWHSEKYLLYLSVFHPWLLWHNIILHPVHSGHVTFKQEPQKASGVKG